MSFSEFFVVIIVAVIVLKPQDTQQLLRVCGFFIGSIVNKLQSYKSIIEEQNDIFNDRSEIFVKKSKSNENKKP